MALGQEDLIWIRMQVGDTPIDADLQQIAALGVSSKVDVAHEVLSVRLANLLASPAVMGVGGGKFSRSFVKNIDALTERIKMLEALPDFSGTPVSLGKVTVTYPTRRRVR